MQYPNRRYGNPAAMRHYAMWYGSTKELARALKRSEKSVRDWLSGRARVPWWVPEIMRLQQMEHNDTARQITGRQVGARLGLVAASGSVIDAGPRLRPRSDVPAPVRHVHNLTGQVSHFALKSVNAPDIDVGQNIDLTEPLIDFDHEDQRRHDQHVQQR